MQTDNYTRRTQLLDTLKQNPDMSANDIAAKLGWGKGGVHSTLSKLALYGVVTRKAIPHRKWRTYVYRYVPPQPLRQSAVTPAQVSLAHVAHEADMLSARAMQGL